MDVDSLNVFLLVGALVLVAAVVAIKFSIRLGLPSLVIYLLIGVAIGEAGLEGAVRGRRAGASAGVRCAGGHLGRTASSGGTRCGRPSRLGFPATVGVAVSTTIMALVGHYVLGLDWTLAVLLGAVFAPTDAAAVFSTLRRVPLSPRLSGALEAEAGLNDAPTVVLVTLVSAGAVAEEGVGAVALTIGYELVAGAAIGLAVGWLGAIVVRRVALPSVGVYPLLVMTLAVLAYAAGAVAHASGFAAVYVAALVLGNSALPHRVATRSFAEGLAWVSQIGLFVMLGLLSSPSKMPDAFVPAIVAGFALTLFARPISVFVATIPFGLAIQERVFLSWAGLRGDSGCARDDPAGGWGRGRRMAVRGRLHRGRCFHLAQAPPLPWLARSSRRGRRCGSQRHRRRIGAVGPHARRPDPGSRTGRSSCTAWRSVSSGYRPTWPSPWSSARIRRSCPLRRRGYSTATRCSSLRLADCGTQPNAASGPSAAVAGWPVGSVTEDARRR